MNKIFRILVLLISLSFGVLLVAPFFISGSALKFQLEQKIGDHLGTDFKIKDKVEIAFLPRPRIILFDVEIENLKQIDHQNKINIDSVSILPALSSLFSDGIKISKILISSAKIELKNSPKNPVEPKDPIQEGLVKVSDMQEKGFASLIFNLKDTKDENFHIKNIDRIELERGYLVGYNKNDELGLEFSSINFLAKNNLQGNSLTIKGSFLSEEVPTIFEMVVDMNKDTESSFLVQSPILKVDIQGKFQEIDLKDPVKSKFLGKIDIRIFDLKMVLSKYFSKNNLIFKKISPTKPIDITADFSGDSGEVKIENIRIDSEIIRGSGNVDASFIKSLPMIDINLVFENIDIKAIWVSEIVTGNESTVKIESSIVDEFISSRRSGNDDNLERSRIVNRSPLPVQKMASSIFKDIDLTAEIKIKLAKYLEGELKDISLYLVLSKDGDLLLQPMIVGIPGNGNLTMSGVFEHENEIPKFIGKIEVTGKKLQQFLAWLKINPQNLKPDSITDYAFNSDILMVPNFTVLSNLYGSLSNGKNLIAGDLKIDDSTGISDISGGFKINYFDVEDYFLVSNQNQYLSRGSLLKKLLWLNTITSNTNISLLFNRLKYKENIFNDQLLKLNFGQGYLALRDFRFNADDFDLEGSFDVDISKQSPVINLSLKSNNFKYFSPQPDESFMKDDAKSKFRSGFVNQFFNLPSLHDFSGVVSFDLKHLKIDDLAIDELKLDGSMKDGVIKLNNFTFNLYRDASFDYQGSVAIKNSKAIVGNFKLNNVNNELLMRDLLATSKISGVSNLAGSVNIEAKNREEFFKNLDIQLKFASSSVFVKGFGIDDLVKKMFQIRQNEAELKKPINILYNKNSKSFFQKVTGSIDIRRNNRENKLRIETSSSGVNSVNTGSLNFESASIEMLSNFVFLTGTRAKQVPINIAINSKGAIDSPLSNVNIDQVNKYLEIVQ